MYLVQYKELGIWHTVEKTENIKSAKSLRNLLENRYARVRIIIDK